MELWLLRHARARAAASGEDDRDRPLTDSGRATAHNLSDWIARKNLAVPTTVRVSPAARTRETARLVLDGLEAPEQGVEPDLWDALEEDLIGVLQKYAKADSLMLVGHNPGFEWLAQWLTNQRPRLGVQPGTLIIIDAEMPPGPGCGRIVELVQPSDLA
jgi:phosphohistidine phosphatase SixA